MILSNLPVVVFILLRYFVFVRANSNFVVILTDDQDLLLDGLEPMRNTLKFVANRGKVFENAFVNSPICCPSRSTIVTGKFAHNTGVVNNSIEGNCSSKNWQNNHEPFSLAALLKEHKYSTFYAGKYLNQYGSKKCGGVSHVPKGYDWWFGLQGNSKYYNYTLSVNGSSVFYKDIYLTDLLANYSLDFLNNKPLGKPFFMTVAPPAPHAPFTPAERHKSAFPATKVVRNPSFNHTAEKKHWIVGMPPSHLPSNSSLLDDVQRHRLQSLLAVDEMVHNIVIKLKVLQEFNNTYIIFTSDNGFHIGQFTQPWDKRQPYETDVRVPLIISGPNVPWKTVESFPVSSVDLAPTILDLANVDVPSFMDGRSFKQKLFSPNRESFERLIFVEYWGEGGGAIDSGCPWKYDRNVSECIVDQWCKCQDSRNNTYACVLTLSELQKFKYCSFEDDRNFREAYDLISDPYELFNAYDKMDSKNVENYNELLKKFQRCSGKDCPF